MQQPKSYIQPDEHGVMRVGSSRVMLDSVVASFQQGHSPETIQQQYPALSLEDVYGAIAWYLANAEEVARYLRSSVIPRHSFLSRTAPYGNGSGNSIRLVGRCTHVMRANLKEQLLRLEPQQ